VSSADFTRRRLGERARARDVTFTAIEKSYRARARRQRGRIAESIAHFRRSSSQSRNFAPRLGLRHRRTTSISERPFPKDRIFPASANGTSSTGKPDHLRRSSQADPANLVDGGVKLSAIGIFAGDSRTVATARIVKIENGGLARMCRWCRRSQDEADCLRV